MLKHGAKHTNDIFERELTKNAYLSRLIDERSNKTSSNDPSKDPSDNSEIQNKMYQLQRDLDQKSK